MAENMTFRPLIGTIVLCAVVALLTASVHGGFMLIFVLPFLSVWLLFSAYASWKRPVERKIRAAKAGLWLTMVVGVLATHWYYHVAARQDADMVVVAVLRYQADHSKFPETLQAAGLKDEPSAWRIRYLFKDGRPYLFYPVTYIVFDTYRYDFESKAWVYGAN